MKVVVALGLLAALAALDRPLPAGGPRDADLLARAKAAKKELQVLADFLKTKDIVLRPVEAVKGSYIQHWFAVGPGRRTMYLVGLNYLPPLTPEQARDKYLGYSLPYVFHGNWALFRIGGPGGNATPEYKAVWNKVLAAFKEYPGPATPKKGGEAQERYVAYWLTREPPDPNRSEYEPVLLLARYPIEQLARLFQGFTPKEIADFLQKRDTLDAPALTIETYKKDSIWNADGWPFKKLQSVGEVNDKQGTVMVNGKKYRFEPCPIKDVVYLLEHPEGKLPVHRIHPPVAGTVQAVTGRALLLLLKEQLASEAPPKKEGEGERAAPRSRSRRVSETDASVVGDHAAHVE
jgi:hypothetical protein